MTVNQQLQTGTIHFCRMDLSALRQQFPAACISLALHQSRGLYLTSVLTSQQGRLFGKHGIRESGDMQVYYHI